MRFQPIAAKLGFAGFAIALAVALTASFGTRLGFWDYRFGLLLLWPAVAAAVIGLAFGTAWLISALARNSSVGTRWGLIGFAGSLVAVAIPLNHLRLVWESPPIHDISTDIEYAPKFEAVLKLRQGAPNGPDYDGPRTLVYDGKKTTVAALQKKFYANIIPFMVLIKPPKMFWRALNAANAMGWRVVAFDPKQGRIEATDTSFWFGFTDDIVIRVKPAGSMGARLDIRSKSRVGDNDGGANADRIRDYFSELKSLG